jgi:hypothetical protein
MTTMRRLAATTMFLASLAMAGSALAVTPEGGRPGQGPVRGVAPGDENCDVTVVFGSYAMGIDGVSFTRVEAYLKRRPNVRFTSTNWGREGEKTVCVDTRNARQTRRVYSDLRGILPRVSRRGPVTIRSNLGQSYQTASPHNMR